MGKMTSTDGYPSWMTPDPSPPYTGPTPPDVLWFVGPDGPLALCWACGRKARLALVGNGRKEPYVDKPCSECGEAEPQQMEMELIE